MSNNDALIRFERLAKLVELDHGNALLLIDYALAALDAGEIKQAAEQLKRLDTMGPLDANTANHAGIAAMRIGDQKLAQLWFARALEESPDDIGLQFNIAWSKALARDLAGAQKLLLREVIDALPQAALLDMQIDHEMRRFEHAEAKMLGYLQKYPDYAPLQAAASMLAMDLGNLELAQATAEKAVDQPDALVTLATLNLGNRLLRDARVQYQTALLARESNPRAEIGLGLVDLAEGALASAAERLDKGAEQLGDHLGTWIAAGWAHVLAGDIGTARDRFETALTHDDTFGETHGSLAIVALLQGDKKAAQHRIKIARRLDQHGFSIALAGMLWEHSQGNQEKAQQIFEAVKQQPILPNGSTLMDELIKAFNNPNVK